MEKSAKKILLFLNRKRRVIAEQKTITKGLDIHPEVKRIINEEIREANAQLKVRLSELLNLNEHLYENRETDTEI